MDNEILKKFTIFQQLNNDEIITIAKNSQEKYYKKDEVILDEHSNKLGLYLIIEGSVSIIKTISDKEENVITTLVAGECFGEISLFDDAPPSAKVKTNEQTTVIYVPKQSFNKIMNDHPEIGLKISTQIIKTISLRLRQTNEQYINLLAWTTTSSQLK